MIRSFKLTVDILIIDGDVNFVDESKLISQLFEINHAFTKENGELATCAFSYPVLIENHPIPENDPVVIPFRRIG